MSEIDTNKTTMSPEDQKAYQAKQKHRAAIMAGLLFFLVVLFYLITFVKINGAVS
ncbi:hypothetical protein [Parasphingorhabdus cellanae]|uniref:Cytochrome C oxidase assembly protein n=1 Tax=Parasphingorhabdus cellanae TaxID=2806553 RepID=A0ABX7TB80_9SPHN|nr:hypothetical protein [Parasphingorhabdus cellanae]QTD57945.1 hypothetical protein J4G78_13980 [Parasphingorhabdus cellanae]